MEAAAAANDRSRAIQGGSSLIIQGILNKEMLFS